MKRLPRKLKKGYSKKGLTWNKRLGVLICTIIDNGQTFRGTMFESKYVGGMDSYPTATITQEIIDIYGKL